MDSPPARKKLKAGKSVPQSQCILCELLRRYSAVYSTREPIHRLDFYLGTLRPVRCGCGEWFLVQEECGT